LPFSADRSTHSTTATGRLGIDVGFELSVVNVDKPELDDAAIQARLRQFVGLRPVWLTRAPTFAEKTRLFPGVNLVMGIDTATRLLDPRYYGGRPEERDAFLNRLRAEGSRIVVAGRLTGNAFRAADCVDVDEPLRELFVLLAEDEFRIDLSSSALRELGDPV
jgi:hypothetical protein